MKLEAYIKNGKVFCMHGEEEIELVLPAETKDTKTQEQHATALAAAKADGIKEGVAAEKNKRKVFAAALKTTGLVGEDAEKFEATFYDCTEDQIKYFATKVIADRAKPAGDGSGSTEAAATDAEAAVAKVTKDAAARFSTDARLRGLWSCKTSNPEAAEYKTNLARYTAAEVKFAADQAKQKALTAAKA